jgi:hypothetical protein
MLLLYVAMETVQATKHMKHVQRIVTLQAVNAQRVSVNLVHIGMVLAVMTVDTV